MLTGCLADELARLRVGKLQHPVSQQLIDRRQDVEPEQSDEASQGRAVDEEREQHEAGSEHGYEAPHLAGQRSVFGDGQRQNQCQGAPQSAPSDRELVGGADRLHQLAERQQRQKQEQHGQPGSERRDDQDGHQRQVMET